MTKNLKGIVIDIGGNTAPLDNALKGVNKTSKDLQKELKDVDRLLKLDPTNTELLEQKQKLLAQSVDNTSNKLKTLKEAEKQVQEQVKQGKVSEEQYRKFQREIVNTETNLKNLKKELGNTSFNFDEIKNKAEVATKAIAGLGVVTATTAIGLGVSAFKSANDFTGAINDIVAKTGLADDETTKFGDTLKNIYANNFGESYEDIASAMATINQQTGLTGEALQKTTENAILLRDTFDFDVNESMRSANMLVTQFGITGDEAYTLIAQGAQQGLDKNGDLLDTINEYSVHFKQLGFNSEEMFSSLVNGANSGTFSVDKLGDSVKEFGIRSKDGSKTTKEAFTALGLDADDLTKKFASGGEEANKAFTEVTTALFNIKDPITQNATGVALFGTAFEDLGVEGIKALSEIGDNANKSLDTLDKMNKIKYNTPIEALQGLGRTIETNVILPIGEKLIPIIEDVIDKLKSPEIQDIIKNITESIFEFVNFILNNGNTIISIISGIGAGLIVWNVASMINGVVKAIKAFQLANEGAKISQALLNGVMAANPIMLIVTLIAGLVTAIVVLWNTNEDFRNALKGIWENITNFVSVAIEKVVGFFTKFVDFIKNNWQSLLLMLVNPFAAGFKLLYDNCDGFREFIDKWIIKIVGFFSELPSKTYNAIIGIKDKFANLKESLTNWAKTELPKFIIQFVGFLASLPVKMKDIGKNIVHGIWDGITGAVGWLKDKIVGFADGIVSKIKETLDIHSPSRRLRDEVGKNMALGIGVGFEDEMDSVNKSMVKAIPTLASDFGINGNRSNNNNVNNNGGFSVTIDKFINNRGQDVEAFAEELGFYNKQRKFALGGAY